MEIQIQKYNALLADEADGNLPLRRTRWVRCQQSLSLTNKHPLHIFIIIIIIINLTILIDIIIIIVIMVMMMVMIRVRMMMMMTLAKAFLGG